MKIVRQPRRRLVSLSGIVLLALASASARAATLVWDTSAAAGYTTGAGTWDLNNTATWSITGTDLQAWGSNANSAQFNMPTATTAVTVDDTNGQVGVDTLFLTGTVTSGKVFTLGGSSLQLGAGGIAANFSGDTVVISAPLVLTASQTWTTTTAGTQGGGGGITVGAISGTANLTLDGRGIYGTEGAGSAVARDGFILNGANTYSGSATVTGGAELILNYTSDGSSKLDDHSALILAGGSIALANGSGISEAVGSTLVAAGANSILTSSLGAGGTTNNIQLGAISRNVGATLDLTNAVSSYAFTTTQNTDGILGGWAVFGGGTSWLVGSSDGTSRAIAGLSGTQRASSSLWGATDNIQTTASEAGIGSKTLNTLIFRSATAGLTLGLDDASTLTLTAGGLIGGAAAGATGQALNGGKLTTGTDTGELFVYAPAAAFTIGSSIVDNGAKPTILVKGGASTLNLTGTNTYTGGTYVNAGTLAIGAGGSIHGSVYIQGAATFDVSASGGYTVASGQKLGGGGTVAGNVVVGSGGLLSPTLAYADDQGVTQHTTGTLKLANSLTLQTGSSISLRLGSESDLVALTGTGTLTGSAAAGGIALLLSDAGDVTVGQTFTLLQWNSGTTLSDFDLSDFAVSGETGTLALDTVNDQLTFTLAAAPEPSTWLLLLGGLGVLVVFVRRRASGGAAHPARIGGHDVLG